jgi:putative resolvase
MRDSMGETDRKLLNSREAARYLGISLNTLYRMEKGGLLRPFRTPGGHRRYPLTMLDAYLERSRDTRTRTSFAH